MASIIRESLLPDGVTEITQSYNFSYDTYNYNVTLSSSAQTATIGATAMQSTSSVEGLGTIKIESTEQTEIVKVKSQNGSSKNSK